MQISESRQRNNRDLRGMNSLGPEGLIYFLSRQLVENFAGSGCSTEEEFTLSNQDVMGLAAAR